MYDDLSLIPNKQKAHDQDEISNTFTYFKGFVLNPTVFCSVAMFYYEGQTWRPLLGFLMPNLTCDVLIG